MKALYNDGTVAELPEEEVTHVVRHSAAHIMAQAIKRLYPEADFAYGPATDNGFYYDVDLGDKKISEEDLPAIEAEMKKIVKENLKFSTFELPREEAIKLMETKAINPAGMITHVGGLNACAETTMNLPKIKGAKKLIYTHVELPLTAIEDFGKAAEENKGTKLGELYADLDAICKDAGELWCAAAEKRLLEYAGFEA